MSKLEIQLTGKEYMSVSKSKKQVEKKEEKVGFLSKGSL